MVAFERKINIKQKRGMKYKEKKKYTLKIPEDVSEKKILERNQK